MYKNYTFIKESVHPFHLKYRYWEELWKGVFPYEKMLLNTAYGFGFANSSPAYPC